MGVWFAILACLAVSFVFSGIEAGILSVNRVRLRHRLKAKDPSALLLNRLLSDPERLLITVLIVTNFMNILALTLGVQELVRLLGTAGYFVALILALPIWAIGLEMLPKSLFRRFPYRALAALSGPLRLADLLLFPLHAIGMRFTRSLALRKYRKPQKLFAGREDFKYMTFESEREGAISAEERAIIHSIVDFRAVTAREVMVPLKQTGAVASSLTIKEAREIARARGLDRVPVVGADGGVTGVVDFHELAVGGQWHGKVEMFQRRILKAELSDSAYGLLRKLRSARQFMAVVRDEAGRSVGIVFWDDLVRKLFLPPIAQAVAKKTKESGQKAPKGN
ncbi:MAG: CNNM domain-containing protein [Verrucomicrobiota bacterium]